MGFSSSSIILALALTKNPCISFFLCYVTLLLKVSISSRLALDRLPSKYSMLLIRSLSFFLMFFLVTREGD